MDTTRCYCVPPSVTDMHGAARETLRETHQSTLMVYMRLLLHEEVPIVKKGGTGLATTDHVGEGRGVRSW